MIKKQIFGLDISDHSIEAFVLAKPYFGKAKVVAYARTLLKGEVVKNGIIKNPKKLEESIIELLQSAQPKPIRTPACILSLPESQVFTTVFKLPAGLKRNEIKNTIPYKAEEVIPFKSTEIYFDFKTLIVEGETQEVFYVAVPAKVIDSYVSVLKNLNLEPVAFDLESISLARALIDPAKRKGQAKLMMDIGSRTTNLNIFDRGGIRQSLVIKIAGDRFTKAIASKLKITPKEAAELKMKNGFDPKVQQGKVLLILQNEFKRIIGETKKLIEFYQTQYNRQIDEIILAGGSSLLPKLDQYLADNSGLKTNIGNPLAKISDPKDLVELKDHSILFANVAGLALRGINKNPVSSDINLLPLPPAKFSLAPPKESKRAWKLVYLRLAVFIILLLVLAGLFMLKQNGLDLYKKVVPVPEYSTVMDSGIDLELLKELREALLVPTPTPTVSPPIAEEIVESENKVLIRQTGLGYLNVREGPGLNFKKINQTDSGTEHILLEEQDDWYLIQLDDETTGWVYSVYVDKLE